MKRIMRQLSGLLVVWAVCAQGPVWADVVERGQTIAQQGNGQGAIACMTCHGLQGEGNMTAAFPRLAGLPAGYLSKQLHDYREGSRQNPVMQPFASALNDEDIRAVASYYESLDGLSLPTAYRAADPGDAAEWLAKRGDWDSGVPACNQCHGPNGQGVGDSFPPLAGQPVSYLKAQLNAWRSGSSRVNDPNGLMKGIAERLSDEQINLISQYYASLPETVTARTSGQGEVQR